jgi:hypothetical protein
VDCASSVDSPISTSIERGSGVVAGDADAARRVALRIAVDQQRALLGDGEAGREVDRRRRLATPPF